MEVFRDTNSFFNVTGVNLNVVLNCNLNIFVFHPGLQSSSITWSINQKLYRSPENSIFRPLLAASFYQRPVLTSCWSWKLAGIKQKRAALRFSDRIEQTLLGDGDTYYHCRVLFFLKRRWLQMRHTHSSLFNSVIKVASVRLKRTQLN